jgi:stage III sporulation protein AA
MNCAWKELLSILPPRLRQQTDIFGKDDGLELRLRLDSLPQLVRKRDLFRLEGSVTADDLHYVINMACRYSPWTAGSAANGYLTAPGGHRIGICGEALMKDGKMEGIREIHSLNIRIARDFPGIGQALCRECGPMLIIGRPGSGKTTLLRDLIRQLSCKENVSVVDERGELFPMGVHRGERMDVLLGCSKAEGIDRVLRTMTPDTIAIDEITAEADTRALMQAAWCGVRLLATAHAANMEDLRSREVYRPLVERKLFTTVVIMRPDKSYYVERMVL